MGRVALGDQDGLVLFVHQPDDSFEMHYLLTSDLTGPEKLNRAKAAISWIFTFTSATRIYGHTPCENRAARAMNRLLGGRPVRSFADALGRNLITYEVGKDHELYR